MRLSEYIEINGHGTMARIARAAGVTQATVGRLARGDVDVRLSTAHAISEATGGAVDMLDLLAPSAAVVDAVPESPADIAWADRVLAGGAAELPREAEHDARYPAHCADCARVISDPIESE